MINWYKNLKLTKKSLLTKELIIAGVALGGIYSINTSTTLNNQNKEIY